MAAGRAGSRIFLHTPREAFQTWWTTEPLKTDVVTGWVGGPASAKLAGQPKNALRDQALEVLARSLSLPHARLQSLLAAWDVFDWQADPFSRGAYAYVPVGESGTPARLAEPADNTLFFAGEATDKRLAGTIAGAMVSGYRAAKQILDAPAAE